VGWVSKHQAGHLGKLKRASLVRLQAHFASKDAEVVKTARDLWHQFFNGDASVLPADFKVKLVCSVCVCVCVRDRWCAWDRIGNCFSTFCVTTRTFLISL
jgi:hypothetical protein